MNAKTVIQRYTQYDNLNIGRENLSEELKAAVPTKEQMERDHVHEAIRIVKRQQEDLNKLSNELYKSNVLFDEKFSEHIDCISDMKFHLDGLLSKLKDKYENQ